MSYRASAWAPCIPQETHGRHGVLPASSRTIGAKRIAHTYLLENQIGEMFSIPTTRIRPDANRRLQPIVVSIGARAGGLVGLRVDSGDNFSLQTANTVRAAMAEGEPVVVSGQLGSFRDATTRLEDRIGVLSTWMRRPR